MNVVRQFSGALTLGWVPDGLIPKYHFDTEYTVLLSRSGRHRTVEDFTFKGLVL